MRFVRQLLPLAILFALVGAIGGGALPARGNVTNLAATATGNSIYVIGTYTNTPAGAPATLTATGNGGFTTATASGGGATVSGFTSGSKTVTTTPATSGTATDTVTIQASFACAAAGPVSFTLTQAGATPASQTASANCAASGTPVAGATPVAGTTPVATTTTTTSATPAAASVTGAITITPSQGTIGQPVNVSATCQAGSVLSSTPPIGTFASAMLNGAPVQVGGGTITCTGAGQLQATYNCMQQGVTTFSLTGATPATGSLSCGTTAQALTGQNLTGLPGTQGTTGAPVLPYTQGATGLPNVGTQGTTGTIGNSATAGQSSPVSITASPTSVSCGGSAQVTISAGQTGTSPMPDGTTVNLYTTSGALNPRTGAIQGGKFVTTLTAPTAPGTATINASVGGVTNSTDVKIDCAAGSAAPATSSPSSQTSPPPPPIAQSGIGNIPAIAPPSTGDAGLKID